MTTTQIARHECERIVTEIEPLEHEAAVCADLLNACTDADADYYRTDAPGCNMVVAGNGVEPFSCTQSRVESWRRFIDVPFPVFVSSAHFPNAAGFWDMMRRA